MKVLIIFRLILSVVKIVSISSISDEVVPNGRVAHGQDAAMDQFKYHVLIELYEKNVSKSYLCGGSIISNEWVLSAAHCFIDIDTSFVYLGMTVSPHWAKKYEITPGDVVLHPDWRRKLPNDNDIALVRIPRTKFSEKIQPVKLPSMNDTNKKYGRQNIIMTGWGLLENNTLPNRLQFAESKVIGKGKCQTWYSKKILSTYICVSGINLVSSCIGDSGGPLVLKSSNVQIGICAFGSTGGCQIGFPEVYTRVSSYLKWIKKFTGVSY